MSLHAYRAALFHLLDDPAAAQGESAHEHFGDGAILVRDGLIEACAPWSDLRQRLPAGVPVSEFPGGLIVPGFVDSHIHYPQTDIIAAPANGLLDWLQRHAFPAEADFADPARARDGARFFLDEMLRNGTTSALVFCTGHNVSVEALFEAAAARNMRLIAGKVLMDRHVPEALRQPPETACEDSARLIRAWHGRKRLGYAITPRFAPACSARQLDLAGRLLKHHDTVHLHTHLSEDESETALVRELFPEADNYLDVYARHGLLTARSVFAHCLHLDESEFAALGKAGASIAFCATSNLFLGSGLFDLDAARRHDVTAGLGTDIGAGTSFSLFRTMNEAYKVCRLRDLAPTGFDLFYLATLGGARALKLADRIGNLQPGKEADFLVLDPVATPLLQRRLAACRTFAEKLFILSMLGDDRLVRRTYVAGRLAHDRDGVTSG
ncbi:MAG: guanine deaminase [Alphaproteobacteria bacterium]